MKFLSIVVACLLAISCGGGGAGSGGGGGNGGSSDTGTVVTASVVPGSVNVDYCSDEGETASATLTADLINSSLPSNTLTTESYRVTFTPLTHGAPVINGGVFSDSRTLPASEFPVSFIGSSDKLALRAALANSGAAYSYTARYRFSGEDLYGTSWSAVGSFAFNLGKFSACPLSIYPPAATVTGINNPDSDLGDDVLFRVSGGTPPFTVFSDSVLLNSPGTLPDGITSFIADPNQATEPTMVTLTVSDSLGALSTATLTVTSP